MSDISANPDEKPRVSPWGAAAAFAFYLAMLAAVTWPLAAHFLDWIPGHPRLSGCVHLWHFWWTREALMDPDLALFFSPMLFHPWGVMTLGEFGNFLLPLLSVPFQADLGLAGSFNLIFFFFLPGAGAGMYLLARRFAAGAPAALLAGAFAVFLPFVWMELFNGALEIAVLFWLPACFLLIDSGLRQPSAWRGALLGGCIFLAAMSSWYYGFFVFLSAGAVILLGVLRPGLIGLDGKPGLRTSLFRMLAAMLAVSLAGMLPFVWLMGQTSRMKIDWHSQAADGSGMSCKTTPDLLNFLGPWQAAFADREMDFGLNSGFLYPFVVFPGCLAIALACIGIFSRRGLPRYYWMLAFCFLILFLGPWLKIAGTSRFFGFEFRMPVYWLATHFEVFAGNLLHSYRAIAVISLAVLLLAARGWDMLLEAMAVSGFRAWAPTLGLCGLAAAGMFNTGRLPCPFPMSGTRLPPAYEKLGALPEAGAVVDVPVSVRSHIAYRYMLAQTIHRRPILSGQAFMAHTYAEVDPFLRQLRRIQDGLATEEDLFLPRPRGLLDAGFRFFIVHWDLMSVPVADIIRDALEPCCSIWADDPENRVTIYEMQP